MGASTMDTHSPSNIANSARIATLRASGLLDSPREESYDRLTRLAAATLHAPIAMMTLVDTERQFYKSSVGLPEPWASGRESPLGTTPCGQVVVSGTPLVVEDIRADPIARAVPAMTEMGIVAYAGVPLRTVEGEVIGAFCSADRSPHPWNSSDVALLEELGAAAMHEMEMHGALRAAAREATRGEGAEGEVDLTRPQAIVEASPVAIGVLQDGLFRFASRALAAMLGYGEAERLAGMSIFDLAAEPERSALRHAFQRFLNRAPDNRVHEFAGVRRDGSAIELELRATRTDIAGRPALVAGLIDITERKASERQLRRNAEQLRALTENAWDVVHMLTPDDVITYISPSVERVLGYKPEEMVGQHSRDFVHPDDLPLADQAFHEDITRPGARRRLELRLRHKDGSWREVEVVGQVLTDPSGAPVAIVNTHDVTEQKFTDRELRRKSASVELLEFVATAANGATSMGDAILPCLERICKYHEWRAARLGLRDSSGNIVSTDTWYLSDPERLAAFRDVTNARVFGPGVGLPGSVLASGEPAWVPDVTEDLTFTRRAEAIASGLRGGIACPLLVGTEVVGVLEFFSDRVLAVDEALMKILSHVGTQLGRVVERERARDALLKSEGRIRAIMELAHDAFVATDMKGLITEWNNQAEVIFGWTREEAIGRSMADTIIPPRHRAAHRRGVRQLLRSRKNAQRSRRLEIEALHREGHEFPVELSISAIPINGGFLIATFLHDITARKQAEEKLRRSEERYDLVSRATSDIVWDWDIASGVLTWNNALQRTCRYQPDQIGTTMEWWYNRIHPADRERVVTGTHAVLNGTREFWTDEYRFRRGDGTYATVLARGHVVRNDRGEAVRMIGSAVDITERKLEEQAQRFIAQASVLLETSLDQEVILNSLARLAVPTLADYCLIDVLQETGGLHRAAKAHVDPSRETLLRTTEAQSGDAGADRELLYKVVRSRQPVLVRECSEAALESLKLTPPHLETLRKLTTTSFMVVPLLTREQVLGAITLGAGESGRHYDLLDLLTAEQLAQRAARTIDNGRLYDHAKRAIRARDEVLAVVSHDLRNPLSTISLSASLLLDESTERRAEPSRFLGVIKRSADQANTMIKNLLDVSSIEAGHFSVNRSREDIAELMRQAHELLSPLAEKKSIHLDWEVPGEHLMASADANQLHRVFSNLVGNAIKFTPEGGVVSVRASVIDGDLQFSVSDNGPGIAAEELPHVFDRFWQGRKGDRRGAGLGLSIVRGIVEAHGGRIWVESRLGSGTSFHFTVPMQRPLNEVEADVSVVALADAPESAHQESEPVRAPPESGRTPPARTDVAPAAE
jgi:PAS domain S-box-containing protein